MRFLRSHLPLLTAALSISIGLLILVDFTPWLRGGYGWRWHLDYVPIRRAIPLLVVVGVYVGVSYGLITRTRRVLPVLIWALLGTSVIGYTAAYAREGDALYALLTRTFSELATGPHYAAAYIDWDSGDWRDWTGVMDDLGGHVGTSPPGLPLLYESLNIAFDGAPITPTLHEALLPYQCHNFDVVAYTPAQWASAWLGVLMPVWAGLTVLPIYGLARHLNYGSEPARYAAIWWALVPAVSAFAGSWSTFFPLMSASAGWLLITGLDATGARREFMLFGAGLVTGIALFMHFTFLPLFGLFGAYALAHEALIKQRERSLDHLINAGMATLLGSLLPWLIFVLLGGDTPVAMLRTSFETHLGLDRPYAFWVWFHVWDWVLWTGIVFGVLWLVTLEGWRSYISHARPRRPILSSALLITVLIMTISGTTQGESGRIWLFMSPFIVIAAAHTLRPGFSVVIPNQPLHYYFPTENARTRAWLTLTVGQSVLLVALLITLNVMQANDLTHSPDLPPPAANLLPIQAQFADSDGHTMRLTGWAGTADPAAITLKLAWASAAQFTEPYWFGAYLIGPDGPRTEPVIWQPGEFVDQQRVPVTCWTPNTVVGDTVILPLPEQAARGEWWISLLLFGDEAVPAGRLIVTRADGSLDNQVTLGPVTVK